MMAAVAAHKCSNYQDFSGMSTLEEVATIASSGGGGGSRSRRGRGKHCYGKKQTKKYCPPKKPKYRKPKK